MAYKVLANVLINERANEFRLADIRFDERIEEIIYRKDYVHEWDEIHSRDELLKILRDIPKQDYQDAEVIDGKFLFAMPGAIDAHVHCNTPGFEDREDIEHASAAAAAGGTTTIIDMPCTSLPPVTCADHFRSKLNILKSRSAVDLALWGGIRGNDFESDLPIETFVGELCALGVVGFKAYLTSGMETFRDLTYEQMLRAAKAVNAVGGMLAIHAEDKELVTSRQKAAIERGDLSAQAYCNSRDSEAEVKAIQTMVQIAKETGCQIHIVHLSSAEGLNVIRQAQSEGLHFTTETCPHYLFFTQDDFRNPAIANYLKTAPPVKLAEDRETLWNGLRDGSIAFVTTDHAGCDPEKEKTSVDFWKVYGGIPGLQHRVPFILTEGFHNRKLTLEECVRILCVNPAWQYSLARKGRLAGGYDADIALIDLWNEEPFQARSMRTKGKYTPFENFVSQAIVQATYLRGECIYDKEKNYLLSGTGKILARE